MRSSYYLEDAAPEFHLQGLELDWACVAWNADLSAARPDLDTWEFKGSRWQRIRSSERKLNLKNACRVLLTRARQGMVIVVPEGDDCDPTRDKAFYDTTCEYLRAVGLPTLAERATLHQHEAVLRGLARRALALLARQQLA